MVSPRQWVNRVLVVVVGLLFVGVLALLGAGESPAALSYSERHWHGTISGVTAENKHTFTAQEGDLIDVWVECQERPDLAIDPWLRISIDEIWYSRASSSSSVHMRETAQKTGSHYVLVEPQYSFETAIDYTVTVRVTHIPASTTTTKPPTTTTTTLPSTTSTTVPPTTTTTLPQSSFVDVATSHPYFAAIQEMAAAGIVSGYPVGGYSEFRPSNPVWRAQFAKMVCGASDIAVNEDMTSSFTDLGSDDPDNLYPHEYVAAAAFNGITSGVGPGLFAPYDDITRAQVVTMMVRAAQQLAAGTLAEPPAGYAGSIGDFSPTHYPSMRMAEYNGLMAGLIGFGSGWDPWQKATRGEVAQVLWQVMQKRD